MNLPRNDTANRLAALYEIRSLRQYVRWKIRMDPVYTAVLEQLRHDKGPVVDVGCGIGLLPFFLREHGFDPPVVGLDVDERKIEVAQRASTRYTAVDFIAADARSPLPVGHNVVILDILQYFSPADQRRILVHAREAVPPGGVIVIRQGIGDGSWRHRVTIVVDWFTHAMRWMSGAPPSLPERSTLLEPFEGFRTEVSPLWGRTPYNNYLFVFRRPLEDPQLAVSLTHSAVDRLPESRTSSRVPAAQ